MLVMSSQHLVEAGQHVFGPLKVDQVVLVSNFPIRNSNTPWLGGQSTLSGSN